MVVSLVFLVIQERFLTSGREEEKSAVRDVSDKTDEASYLWWVPLTCTTPGKSFDNMYPTHWLKPETADTPIKISGMPDKATPVVFNVQQTGRSISYQLRYVQ